MLKPRALKSGDRIALVAPASPLPESAAGAEIEAGIAELNALGFEVDYDETLLERTGYTAGSAETRAAALRGAWADPSVAAILCLRGGYGSVQLLPLLDAQEFRAAPKAFIGYSDNTSILAWLALQCGIVCFHGPMIDRRLSRAETGYDRDTFERALMRTGPIGTIQHPQLEAVRPGEASGLLVGGTMTQLAASLGTPWAFDPPPGCVLFFDEVAERPYRVDRLYTQLAQAGVLARAAALVFGEMPRCDEPAGGPAIRDVVRAITKDFSGPVLFGLPSGHTETATLTLPFGVRARVTTGGSPAIDIEEAAVI